MKVSEVIAELKKLPQNEELMIDVNLFSDLIKVTNVDEEQPVLRCGGVRISNNEAAIQIEQELEGE